MISDISEFVISGFIFRSNFKSLIINSKKRVVVNFAIVNSYKKPDNDPNFFNMVFWFEDNEQNRKRYVQALAKGNRILVKGIIKYRARKEKNQSGKIEFIVDKILSFSPTQKTPSNLDVDYNRYIEQPYSDYSDNGYGFEESHTNYFTEIEEENNEMVRGETSDDFIEKAESSDFGSGAMDVVFDGDEDNNLDFEHENNI